MTSRTATRRRREVERPTLTLPGRVGLGGVERRRMLAEVLAQPDAELVRGWGYPQWRHCARATVPDVLRCGVYEAGPLPRWCHEAAATFAIQQQARGDVVVVHGAVMERQAPFWHSWCVIGGEAVFDSTTSEFYVRGSWDEVLQTVEVCRHSAEEVAGRVEATGQLGPWEDCRLRHAAVVGGWLEQLAREHPDLDRWVTAMSDHDSAFRVAWEALAGPEFLGIVDALAWLAQRPALWREHPPGRGRGRTCRSYNQRCADSASDEKGSSSDGLEWWRRRDDQIRRQARQLRRGRRQGRRHGR